MVNQPVSVSGFTPHAAYYKTLDCIEYVNQDCTVISERIDELLTLFRKNGTSEYVGFKIKGFRNYFENTLRSHCNLAEEDFPTLTNIMQSIWEDRAPIFMSNLNSTDKAEQAYLIAYEMAKKEAIELSGFPFQQAA